MWVPDEWPLQFVALMYLDDLLLMRYDSSTRMTLPCAPWMRRVEEKDPNFWTWQSWCAEHLRKVFTKDVALLQEHSNQRGKPYTFQRTARCKLSEDGQTGALMRYGYNGRDLLLFEKENQTWTPASALAKMLKEKWDADLIPAQRAKAFLDERCPELLQQCLDYGEESLQRTEPPVVKVAQKASGDRWETVICRAYGFYPKEVTISWRKDEEVWEEGTLRGGVTPNSDGTYHTWLSIRMDPKDRSHYRCRVEHAGLSEPLDVAWKEPASLWALLGTVLGVVAAALLLVSWIYMRHSGDVEKAAEPLFWSMTSAARISYAQHWKCVEVPTLEEWWTKVRNFAEMDKLTILPREKSTQIFRNNWKPLIEYLQEKDKNELTTIGVED